MEVCKYCIGTRYTRKPFRVITHSGAARDVVFDFCPSCGRKLKPENPTAMAYHILVGVAHTPTSPDELTAAIEEAIGYLGEALA